MTDRAEQLLSDILLMKEAEIAAIHYLLFTRGEADANINLLLAAEMVAAVRALKKDDQRDILIALNKRRAAIKTEEARQAVEEAANRSRRIEARHPDEKKNGTVSRTGQVRKKYVSKKAVKGLFGDDKK